MRVEPGPGPEPARTWLDEKEAAVQVGVKPRTIRRWSEAGYLHPRKVAGKNWYRWAEVAEVEAARRTIRTRPYG